MRVTITTVTRFQLDWLCIVHRALEAAPTSDILWAHAVITLRGLITAFDTLACDDNDAAHAQYLLNKLVAYALTPADARTVSGAPVPLVSEHLKDQLMHLAARGTTNLR